MSKTGKGIKTREAARDGRAPDRRTTAAGRMKRAAGRSVDSYRRLADNREDNRDGSPAEYAEDRIRDTLEGTASGTGRRMKRVIRSARERAGDRTFWEEDAPAETADGIRGEARSIAHDRSAVKDPKPSNGLHNVNMERRTGDGTARQQTYGIRRTNAVVEKNDSMRRPAGAAREPSRLVGLEGRTLRRAERETVRGTAETAGGGIRTVGQTAGASVNSAARFAASFGYPCESRLFSTFSDNADALCGVRTSSITTISDSISLRRNGKSSLPKRKYTNRNAQISVITGATAKPAHIPFIPKIREPRVGKRTYNKPFCRHAMQVAIPMRSISI